MRGRLVVIVHGKSLLRAGLALRFNYVSLVVAHYIWYV